MYQQVFVVTQATRLSFPVFVSVFTNEWKSAFKLKTNGKGTEKAYPDKTNDTCQITCINCVVRAIRWKWFTRSIIFKGGIYFTYKLIVNVSVSSDHKKFLSLFEKEI